MCPRAPWSRSHWLGGNTIEFVSSYSHLEHLITDGRDDSLVDIAKRQDYFIGQVNSIACYFQQLTSAVKYCLLHSVCSSLYGCKLWQLSNYIEKTAYSLFNVV